MSASAPCGYAATCGRPTGHRGQHGGWRSGIRGVAQDPYSHASLIVLGSDMPEGTLRALVEYVHHGSAKEVGACLGLSEQTIKNHLATAHQRTGANTTIETFVALGWLEIPTGLGDKHRVAA